MRKAKEKESLIEVKTRIDKSDIKDLSSLVAKLKQTPDAVSAFVERPAVQRNRPSAWRSTITRPRITSLRFHLARDLDDIVTQDTALGQEEEADSLR